MMIFYIQIQLSSTLQVLILYSQVYYRHNQQKIKAAVHNTLIFTFT